MQQDKSFLGTEPIGGLLFRLAVPTVVAQLVNILYNIVDRAYIGHMPQDGSLALTGLGVCMPIILVVSAFAALVGSGGGPRASIYMGKGDNETAEKILGTCFTAQIVISAALTAALLLFGRQMLLVFGASGNTIDFADAYLSIYALGTVFVQLTLGMNAFITAQGFTKQSMSTVIIGAVCNIILDPIFIFVLGMGVRGAALATVISQELSCIWVLRFLTGGQTVLRLRYSNLFAGADYVLPCLALGAASFIMQSTESALFVCFNSSLLRYGGDIAVGSMTILSSVIQFAMMPLQGIAMGAQPILSYNYGAKNYERVRSAFKLLLGVSLSFSTAIWLLVMLFPQIFAAIFTSDAELIAFTVTSLRIYLAVMFIFGIQLSCQITFVSLGNAPCSIIVAVVRKLVLLIPLIYILPHLVPDPTMGVYLAEPVSDFIAVSFTAILFSQQFKKALSK